METMKTVSLGKSIRNNWQLYMPILPALIYLVIFNYLPMYGVQIAFRNYKAVEGITGSAWVGLRHFRTFFQTHYSTRLITNTFLLNFYGLLFGFPIPIVLAILINNLRSKHFKKFTQTVVYIPHFISTVVLAGMLYIFLSPVSGIINRAISALAACCTCGFFAYSCKKSRSMGMLSEFARYKYSCL
jgi:putative aldouronate transport system permease protein